MKGIVFTEFLEMVEEKFGYKMVDNLLSTTELPSDGIYTSVGTYQHTEMVSLVINLGNQTNIPINELLKIFGGYLFKTFTKTYSHFMAKAPDAFTFLASIHNYIHVEVQKLYPDAELPHFDIERPDENTLIMTYTSARKMADLAFGLIEGCIEYYQENVEISQIPLNEDGSSTKFVIIKK
ncbi:heme NO-binding domain-containing protein [Arcicella sp. LKC2W]|uniref:heme NO-binding domain-containing protein n=1 Tax=Arcicella sp. LKC2W TaxID=2984198 RepID=UPI002B1F73C9|nr:heme NO-binding domain-containing protein [Arcicella sp. LKC2W]MEA5460782.1 heme NO-binding domain-containing protein [Arcicella sp. LKC2W]